MSEMLTDSNEVTLSSQGKRKSFTHARKLRAIEIRQSKLQQKCMSYLSKRNNPSNHIDYRRENGPCLSLLWSEEELQGQTLYLGGDEGVDGNIYCIPGHASQVLCIDPRTDRIFPIGPVLSGKFKWLRGIRINNIIYGLPCHASTVLRIDTLSQTVTLMNIPYETFYADYPEGVTQSQRQMEWKYHGGSYLKSEHCIYAIPQSAWHVLRIDVMRQVCSFVPSEPLLGRYKWYGGVVGRTDGAIYGTPHNASNIIRIQNNSLSLHGHFPANQHSWHGAAVSSDDKGTIVCVPANADSVLCIEPGSPPHWYELKSPCHIRTGRHREDGKYKYLGAMASSAKCNDKGAVYCFPSGAEYVLRVDTNNKIVQSIGPNLVDLEKKVQNKWQNGIRVGDIIYAIPLSSESVLKIDIREPRTITTWMLPQSHLGGLAKWEGAVLSSITGAIYCMPNNHKAVLRIGSTPSPSIISTENGVSMIVCGKKSIDETKISEMNQDKITPGTNAGTNAECLVEKPSNPTLDCTTISMNSQRLGSNPTTTSRVEHEYIYTTGIPTLRSSAHRVKYSPKHRNTIKNRGKCLPPEICENLIIPYDTEKYNFTAAAKDFLETCDPSIVGTFRSSRLEDLSIPSHSLNRSANGGICEQAQSSLSDQLANYQPFLQIFDDFVIQCILPDLKRRIRSLATSHDTTMALLDSPMTFYYQRPPTMRLQPGPARAQVKAHCDSVYGHQDGELNFWLPLTDRNQTKVDLHVSPSPHFPNPCPAIPIQVGEVLSFHGTKRSHFVNSNPTPYTRVSLDFRVGVEGYFDPEWEMVGTTSDHTRKCVSI
jgi:hypothetical protein